jgi:hypothetical protein
VREAAAVSRVSRSVVMADSSGSDSVGTAHCRANSTAARRRVRSSAGTAVVRAGAIDVSLTGVDAAGEAVETAGIGTDSGFRRLGG